MARFFEAELVSRERPAAHLWIGRFRRTDDEVLRPRPGQFCMVHEEFDGVRLNRSYSLADTLEPGDELDHFTFAVALVNGGRFSRILNRMEPGDTLKMSGPHGRFLLRDTDPPHTVMVATGTGIVPFRSMRKQLSERLERGERVALYYGCRTEDDFLYHEEFLELADRFPRFNYTRCASRAASPGAWKAAGGHCGRVTGPIEELDVSPEDAMIYLCGNPDMIAELKQHFASRGFDRRSVRTEAYESPSDP